MASIIYLQFYHNLGCGLIDWRAGSGSGQSLALCGATYTPDLTETSWAEGTDPYGKEVTGTGYTTGGLAFSVGTFNITSAAVYFIKPDLTFEALGTGTAFQYGIMRDETADLIACFDAGTVVTAANEDVVWDWNAAGMLYFAKKV